MDSLGSASDREARLESGAVRFTELQHYSGAMFDCAKEWYRGADRLYHLEKWLAGLGTDCEAGDKLLVQWKA